MMTSSAVKANLGAPRKKPLDVKLNKSRNAESEAIHQECYQELVMVRDSLATEFGIKANSIVSLEVRIRLIIVTIIEGFRRTLPVFYTKYLFQK